tara:strand:- start:209 stop:775 length:567 start_codon:yes stop_codon:yes gene_type:complete
MNLPNALSVSRIPVVFLIAWLMTVNTPSANLWALVLFVASALTDWLDGYLARRLGLITDFGKFADALADKVLTTGLFISLAALDRLPENWGLFAVLVIVTREFMVTGLRLVAAGKGRVMAAEGLGKWKTALQMVSIGMFLLVEVIPSGKPDLVVQCYHSAGIAFAAATLLTLVSGVSYFSKNREVFSG